MNGPEYEPMWISVVQSSGRTIRVDVGRIIETRLCIVTAEGSVIPFVMNRAQRAFFRLIARDWNAGKPVRYIVLKARQLGISTLVEAIIMVLCTFQRNKQGIIVSKDPDSASDVFKMSKGFVERWRDKEHPVRLKKNNAKALQFSDTGSEIQVVSVEKGVRGGTKQYAHLSEFGFWPNPEEVMTAMVPSIHDLPHTICVIESTANGFNDFMDRWNKAVEGDGGYKPFFLPWTDNPEYVAEPDGREFDQEERKLLALGLTPQQIQWRRNQISKLGKRKFLQEYPRTPEEAFQSTGTGVFDPEKIRAALERTRLLAPTVKRGRYDYDESVIEKDGRPVGFRISRIRWIDDPEGPVRKFLQPVKGAAYSLGGDTADGGADRWTADVNLAPYGIQAATFCAEGIEAHDYACQMVCLGYEYNTAIIAIEVNKSRTAMKDVIASGYPNTYVMREEETIEQDVSNRDGFTTTSVTKKTIVMDMQTHFSRFPDRVNDHATVNEMSTYVTMPTASGKSTTWGASSRKYHDDRVMARAISLHVMPDARPIGAEGERQKSAFDWVDETLAKAAGAKRIGRKPLW